MSSTVRSATYGVSPARPTLKWLEQTTNKAKGKFFVHGRDSNKLEQISAQDHNQSHRSLRRPTTNHDPIRRCLGRWSQPVST